MKRPGPGAGKESVMHRKDDFLEIRLPKCTVFLRPAEINRLLMQDPVLFQQAIQRGKGILRARQARERQSKKQGGLRHELQARL